MAIFLDTTGEPTLGIGICARCGFKFPLVQLTSDPNYPGLKVCAKDRDQFDPYRLPARQTERINLPFVRPDVPLTDSSGGSLRAPTGLAATNTSSGVSLAWGPSPPPVNSYGVFRQTEGAGPFNLIATVGNGALSYTDTTVASGTNYAYYIVGIASVAGSPDQFSSPSAIANVFSLPGFFIITRGPAASPGSVQGGYYIYSGDGVSWIQATVQSATPGTSSLCQAAYSPSLRKWLIADSGGQCLHSSVDGVNWAKVVMPVLQQWTGVAWSPTLNLFAACNLGASAATGIATSPDGVTWTTRAASFTLQGASSNCAVIRWIPWANGGAGLFLLCANGNSATPAQWSVDGITWASSTTSTNFYVGNVVDTGATNHILWANVLGSTSQLIASQDGGKTWAWNPNSLVGIGGYYYLPAANKVFYLAVSGTVFQYANTPVAPFPPGSSAGWVIGNANITPPVSLLVGGTQWPVDLMYSTKLGMAVVATMNNASSTGYGGNNRILTTKDGINWNSYFPKLTTLTPLQFDTQHFGLTAAAF